MLFKVIFLLLGLAMLYGGAEWLVKGASRLAFHFRVSAVVVGLTVVAFGTSAPELVVSFLSALEGSPGIALGNIVGSNIANIGLIIGLCALTAPMTVKMRIVNVEAPVMLAVTALFAWIAKNGEVSRWEGLSFLGLFTVFLLYMLRSALRERRDVKEEFQELAPVESNHLWKHILLIIAGLAFLVTGAQLFTDSAVFIAKALGISELAIGLTLVAVGTSLPELATSLVAAVRKESDIAIGNIVGSNIFNILFIMGAVSVIHPILLSAAAVSLSLASVLIITLILLPMAHRGHHISSGNGVLLLVLYGLYLVVTFAS